MKKIIISIIIIIFGFAAAYYYSLSSQENNTICIKKLDPYKPLISRVPINDTREENRQYYYNDTWVKKCYN